MMHGRRPPGRPTSLTPERHAAIVGHIRGGMYAKVAAETEGVSEATFYRWLERGQADEEPFVTFRQDVEQASAEAELDAIRAIHEAAKKDWRAAAWFLERRFPNEWGRGRSSTQPTESVELRWAVDAEDVMAKLDRLAASMDISIVHEEPEN